MDPGTISERPVVLSVEQALSMSYATLRFVQLGWRVIRVEPAGAPAGRSPGDPNRYVGRPVAGEDRHAYFIAPNVGKEAIALDLKQAEGRELLRRLVAELAVDVFCTNTLPARHQGLGLDYETLGAGRPELVWCCISALGLAHPEVPGYDPVLQALCGYMDLTGEPDGPPLLCGPPIVDLKAGDEAFAQILLALLERARSGRGRAIDVSMAQVAVSWLLTFLPLLDLGSPPEELRRSGNRHRQFIPTNGYPTSDGFVYLAVGSDAQWRRLVAQPLFASLDEPRFGTNEGRRAGKDELHRAIACLTAARARAEVSEALTRAGVPHAPITPVAELMGLDFVAPALLRTTAPDGRVVRLPPPSAATAHLRAVGGELRFAPAYGEHTDAVLAEIGLGTAQIAALRARGVVA
ncbi:MAG: CoA transferase [Deltaproteobacteria bacterium]|nr:CoA transferase [Deltaproteobacteria bacterium]